MPTKLSGSPDQLADTFATLQSRRDVAKLLEIPYGKLTYHLFQVPEADKYQKISLQKRGGRGSREIRIPVTALKIIQRKLNQVLQVVFNPRDSTHGFVPGRSIVTNARQHVRKRWVCSVDLRDFFPSINFGRVLGLFKAHPYNVPHDAAVAIAQICCHQNELPQGAPSSPVVANMICAQLDSQLQSFAGFHRCTYTRYADDLTFSTSEEAFPREIVYLRDYPSDPRCVVGPGLKGIIESNGFQINKEKVSLHRYDQRQMVTGLKVNSRVNVPDAFISQVRAMLHAWEKFGEEAASEEHFRIYDEKNRHPRYDDPSFRRIVWGKLQYVKMVRGADDSKYLRFLHQYKELVGENPNDAVWVLESEEASVQGTAFTVAGIGLVTGAHVVFEDTHAFRPEYPEEKFEVEILRLNEDLDVAVLGFAAEDLYLLQRGSGNSVQVGTPVSILGLPNYYFGDQVHRYDGRIAGVISRHGIHHFRIDAPILFGCSGGPVLDPDGRVIGVALRGENEPSDQPSEPAAAISIDVFEDLDWLREDASAS